MPSESKYRMVINYGFGRVPIGKFEHNLRNKVYDYCGEVQVASYAAEPLSVLKEVLLHDQKSYDKFLKEKGDSPNLDRWFWQPKTWNQFYLYIKITDDTTEKSVSYSDFESANEFLNDEMEKAFSPSL